MERHWIEAVHDPAYVDEVLSSTVPSSKERRIGFPVTARIARRWLHSSGGTWLAARLALRHCHAAHSAGGSHHAQAATGAGYSVLNALEIAAKRMLAEGDAAHHLILDFDVPSGDGTALLDR